MANPNLAITYGEFRTEVALMLNDPSYLIWSEDQILAYTNMALRDYTQHFPRVTGIDLTDFPSYQPPGLTAKPLPDNFIEAVAVWYKRNGDNYKRLYLVDLQEVTAGNKDAYAITAGRSVADLQAAQNYDTMIWVYSPEPNTNIELAYNATREQVVEPEPPRPITDVDIDAQHNHAHILQAFIVWQAMQQLVTTDTSNQAGNPTPGEVTYLVEAAGVNVRGLERAYYKMVAHAIRQQATIRPVIWTEPYIY